MRQTQSMLRDVPIDASGDVEVQRSGGYRGVQPSSGVPGDIMLPDAALGRHVDLGHCASESLPA